MSKPVKTADIVFTIKFEDGTTAKMTAAQIAQMKEKRRYEVVDPRGNVIFKKTFRGL
jgi:hypothetical protein